MREGAEDHPGPLYDAKQLKSFIVEAEENERNWRDWFSTEGVTPLELVYEDLSADPLASLTLVLAALGRDPAIATTTTPQTARLSGAVSRDWAERYRQEGT